MALSNCFNSILCGLSTGVRNALSALIQGYIAQLDAQISVLEGKLVYLDILAAPPSILNNLVQNTLSQIKSGANLIPLNAIGTCIEVGDLNTAIQTNIDAIAISANNIAGDLSRLLSFKDEVEAIIEDLKTTRDLYLQVLSQIDVCNQIQL